MNVAMRRTPLTSLAIEEFLVYIRKSCLFSSAKIEISGGDLEFLISLALQADLTEYIYSQSEEEEESVANLASKINYILSSGQQPRDQDILILACYTPLNKLETINLFESTFRTEEVLRRQVTERNEEIALRAHIPSLSPIKDKTSNLVKQQYEENPFPRWIQTGLIGGNEWYYEDFSKGRGEKITHRKVPRTNLDEILIAGCGTGRQAIERAKGINDCSIVAVDLSINSLCYALRKTKQYGIKNIKYVQGDILDVHKLRKTFDIIECGGVLHHMSDPKKGLVSLKRLLKPNGRMLLGLYSEHARGQNGFNLVEFIDLAKSLGVTEDLTSIRAFREKLVKLNHHKGDSWDVAGFQDFYSTSEFRDLFLNRLEIRMEIPEIKKLLDQSGLEFKGFTSLKNRVFEQFRNEHPDEDDLLDLDKWNDFEVKTLELYWDVPILVRQKGCLNLPEKTVTAQLA